MIPAHPPQRSSAPTRLRAQTSGDFSKNSRSITRRTLPARRNRATRKSVPPLDARPARGVPCLMQDLGKLLVVAGLALAAVGALLWLGKGFRLPGDIVLARGNFTFTFPIVTCLVLSIALTILLNLFFRR
jgi:hypothetical protein